MNRNLLFLSAALIAAPALADGMEADSARWLQDVTVTAIKQTSDLTLTPGAVTVVDANKARIWNIESMKGLSEIAPNFYMPDYGSRITSSIYVRGLGARMEQPAVGLSVDNVPFMNKNSYDFDVIDIAKMEVLRGPQSTLYGRNTMAGQINIYTLQPMDYQGSKVKAMFGNGPDAQIALSHYRKFKENLAMGFVGNFHFSDGFYKNYYNARKIDTEKGGSLRWKTQWQASFRLSLENAASFSHSRQNGYPYELAGSGIVNYNDTCFYRRNLLADALTLKWTGSKFSVSSITSVQYLDDNMTLDQDFLPIDYFTLTQAQHEWSITQDLVIRGTAEKYSWMAGAFGFYKRTSMNAPVTLKKDGIERLITDRVNLNDRIPVQLKWDSPDILLGSRFKIPVWGVALYHQSSLDLGRWNLALGMRLDYESTRLDYNSLCNTSFSVSMKPGRPPMMPATTYDVNIDDGGRLKDHFLEFLPKFTVSYELPMPTRSTLYASIGKGYKSGGYNTQMFSEVLQQRMMSEAMSAMPGAGSGDSAGPDVDKIVSYRPEKSWNYEVGAHIGCADGRVLTDLALFYIDCRDQQLTMFPEGTTTGRITTNAGKTRSFGAEVQIRYNPTDKWAFNLAYGYTNAKFLRFVDGDDDYKGNYVPYAPRNTIFGSVIFTHPVGDNWKFSYNANCRAVGPIYWNESNTVRQRLYALLGASVTVSRDWLSLEAWMNNITGTHYNTFYFRSMNNDFLQKGDPWTFGMTVRLAFDAPAGK